MSCNREEDQYVDLLRDIRDNGVVQGDERTGVGTREVFGRMMRFDLSDGTVPILTTKRVFFKTAFREMLWMLAGGDSIAPLVHQGVSIWTDWPHKKYVQETGDAIDIKGFEARIAADEEFAEKWGGLGPVYGARWRRWPTYEPAGNDEDGDPLFRAGKPIDQIQDAVDQLRANPGSRRHIFTAWDVASLKDMALPPCHMVYQFQVADGRLNGALFQRSTDAFAGLPFNIANLALVTRLLAMHAGLEPGEIVWMGTCVHVYNNQTDAVATQLLNEPRAFPRLEIAPRASIFDHEIGDFTVTGYDPHSKISAPIAV